MSVIGTRIGPHSRLGTKTMFQPTYFFACSFWSLTSSFAAPGVPALHDSPNRRSRPPIRHSGEGRNPAGRGWGNVVRSKTTRGEGLVPRWGGGGAWQNPWCQFAVPSHNSSFSYLGVPAAAGMSDWCESMSRTPIRDDVTRPRVYSHSTAPTS